MKPSALAAALFGRMERHHWAGLGGSVLLHLAVLLGLEQGPPPDIQPVSFEIALEAPKPEPQARSQAKLRLKDTKPRQALAKKKKKKASPREPDTLEARWQPEKRPAKDLPRLDLPEPRSTASADAPQADSPAAAKPLLGVPVQQPALQVATAEAPGPALPATNTPLPGANTSPAAAESSQLAEPSAQGGHPGSTPGPAGDPGLALAASTSLATALASSHPVAGAQGSQAGAARAGGGSEGGGQGPASLAAAGGGGGLNLAQGGGAQSASSREAPPLAGGEPQGIRLSASGSLSERADLPAGAGALSAGPVAPETGRSAPNQAQGPGNALSSARAGGPPGSPAQQTGKGPGGNLDVPAMAKAGSGGDAPSRLAASGSPGKAPPRKPTGGKGAGKDSAAAPGGGDGSSGNASLAASTGTLGKTGQASQRLAGKSGSGGAGHSQANASLALAPGEPGSSPNLAVTLQTLVAVPGGRGGGRTGSGPAARRTPGGSGSPGYPGATLVQAGGSSGGSGAAPTRLALAGSDGNSLSPLGGKTLRDGHGDLSAALAAQAGTAGRERSPDPGRLQALAVPEKQLARPDSQARPLDVLAPSTFCPLPLPGHSFPDNRPPRPDGNSSQPGYAQDNPSFTFPVQALLGNIQGKVTVRVEVQPDGKPGRMWLKQSSGSGILDRDALAQLTLWRFTPARREGQPVVAWIDVPVVYRLQDNNKK